MNTIHPPSQVFATASVPHASCVEASEQLALPTPLSSEWLFQGQRAVHILHQGEVYRLQITRQGKLILTK